MWASYTRYLREELRATQYIRMSVFFFFEPGVQPLTSVKISAAIVPEH